MYKITIEQIKTITVRRNEYEKIADTGNKNDGGAVYGYVSNEREENLEIEIYTQKTEKEINLKAIIDAFNS